MLIKILLVLIGYVKNVILTMFFEDDSGAHYAGRDTSIDKHCITALNIKIVHV